MRIFVIKEGISLFTSILCNQNIRKKRLTFIYNQDVLITPVSYLKTNNVAQTALY